MLNDQIARYGRALTANIEDNNQVLHIQAVFFEHMYFAAQSVASVWNTNNTRLKTSYKARELVAFDRTTDKLIKQLGTYLK